jgi:hypothetical protein
VPFSSPRSCFFRLPHIGNACIDKEAKDKVRVGFVRKGECGRGDNKNDNKDYPVMKHGVLLSLPLCIHPVRKNDRYFEPRTDRPELRKPQPL